MSQPAAILEFLESHANQVCLSSEVWGDRTLALTSDPHTYGRAGKYRVLVKVVDIFGNDTSKVYNVEVK